MNRATGVAIKTLISLLILLMLGFQVLVVSGLVQSASHGAPGLEGIEFLLWICVLLFVVCAQAALLFVWRLVSLVGTGRIFNERAFVWVDAILVCVFVGMGLTVVATVIVAALNSGVPPIVGLFGVFSTLVCLALALLIVVMRALLKQAMHLENELAEVV